MEIYKCEPRTVVHYIMGISLYPEPVTVYTADDANCIISDDVKLASLFDAD
jgi:hypothetical protein